jgi:hypothetical protein
MLSNPNANIRLRPHSLAIRPNSRIPLHKVLQTDLLVASNLATLHTLGNIVKLFAVGHHSRLRGLGSLDSVARRGCWRGLVCRCGSRFPPSNDTNTHIDLRPHARAVVPDGRIPLSEFSDGDFLVADDLAAVHALGNLVELGAVGDHARLSGLRCGNAIASGSCRRYHWCRCHGLGCSDRTADDANAHIDLRPHAGAVVADSRIPLSEFSDGDFLEADDLAAVHAFSNPVELGAVGDHARLGRLRC